MSVSVIILCYKRFKHLSTVVEAWRACGADEIIIWDESPTGEGRLTPNVDQYIYSSYNHGSHVKFKIGLLAGGRQLIVADDDLYPLDTVQSLGHWHDRLSARHKADCVVGCYGRQLGPGYRSHPVVNSNKLTEPVKVSFLGRMYCGSRELLAHPCILGCSDQRMDDLHWSIHIGCDLYVVPFKWANTPECNDANSISRGAGFYAARDDYVRKHLGG